MRALGLAWGTLALVPALLGVDPGALEHDLHAVVSETMQPSHASVWLREARA